MVREGDKTHIWLNDQGKAKSFNVELGAAIGAKFSIASGLKAGNQLIVKGMSRLQEGISLQLAQGTHP